MGSRLITEYELWEFGGDNYECNQFLYRSRSRKECEERVSKKGLKKGDYFIHTQQIAINHIGE